MHLKFSAAVIFGRISRQAGLTTLAHVPIRAMATVFGIFPASPKWERTEADGLLIVLTDVVVRRHP